MRSYFKLAFKVLGRRKFFTFISLFGITLTLVVLLVATAIIDNMFAPRKPESRFDRVLCLYRVTLRGPENTESMNPGFGLIHDWVYTLPGIEAAGAFSETESIAIYRQNGRSESELKKTDAGYWRILDFKFLEGRPFTAQEEKRGALVAVITDALGHRLFDKQSPIDKTIEIDGRDFRIIGVVPAVLMTRWAAYSEVWVPHTTSKSSEYLHSFMGHYNGLVLARSRTDLPRLQREFDARVARMPIEDPKTFKEIDTGLDTPFEALARDMTNGPLFRTRSNRVLFMRGLLVFSALLFMMLPALNLITLNLSRILERAPEIGVRKAFGASRRALVSQFVFENVVLTLIGGVIAFIVATTLIVVLNVSNVIAAEQFDINLRVFAWGIVIATFFGVLSGVYPAWRMSRLHPVNALRGGAQ